MAFTVGGDPSANSYASVEYADGYFADRGVTAWSSAPTPARQGALVRATDYVRAFFEPRFDPALVDPVALPDSLLRAVCLYALAELTSTGSLAPNAPDSPTTVVTKDKVGPLETTYTVVGTTPAPGTRKAFPVADALIAGLLLPVQGLTSVIR